MCDVPGGDNAVILMDGIDAHGGHDNPVLQLNPANLDRGKQHAHGKASFLGRKNSFSSI
ncbi:hypothetical protein D3C71_2225100 [compost metagenome]